MNIVARFCEIPLETEFEFFGRRYRKTAGGMAEIMDATLWGDVFMADCDVQVAEGTPVFLGPYARLHWNWLEHSAPSPVARWSEADFERLPRVQGT
jgi:hypothetical protein